MVIADGAAFGPEMDRVLQLVQTRENLTLYLPESFEWLILSSGILKDAEVVQICRRRLTTSMARTISAGNVTLRRF